MLIRFSIKNWMSFQDLSTFSLIATEEPQYSERIPRIQVDELKLKILPIAAIFGGNASGKTNLFESLSFAQNLIVRGTQPDSLIPVNTFKLGGSEKKNSPTEFEFELLIDDQIYAFSFSLDRKVIIEEKLIHIFSNKEEVLYHRKKNKISFSTSFNNSQFFDFVFQGTRKNQLFLTNSVFQNIDHFKSIYDWFSTKLVLIFPLSRFGPVEKFLNEKEFLSSTINQILPLLDTGISRIGSEEIPFESLPLSEEEKMHFKEQLPEGKSVSITPLNRYSVNTCFVITRKNGRLSAAKLVTYHLNANGEEIKFDISQESDGTQRLIDLLPAFLEMSLTKSQRVFVIDEIDRSLHTLLVKYLIENYLSKCSSISRQQLLFTTHNTLLMDQKLLREDEMWLTERNKYGASRIFSFSEYNNIKEDTNLIKSYFDGRLGGIPRFFFNYPQIERN